MTDETKANDQEEPTGKEGQQDARGNEGMDELAAATRKLQEAQSAAEGYKDQLLRKAAEFENYKRRVDAERADFIRSATESLMLALVPILNDFARSLKLGKEQKNYDAFYKGVELIYSKFSQTLESRGLTPFDSVGMPFDVSLHDALLQVPRSDVPPHTVVEEIERGYKLGDRVLRHARVIVSSDSPSPAATDGVRVQREETAD